MKRPLIKYLISGILNQTSSQSRSFVMQYNTAVDGLECWAGSFVVEDGKQISIDWGDGSSPTIVTSAEGQTNPVHTYATPGIKVITIENFDALLMFQMWAHMVITFDASNPLPVNCKSVYLYGDGVLANFNDVPIPKTIYRLTIDNCSNITWDIDESTLMDKNMPLPGDTYGDGSPVRGLYLAGECPGITWNISSSNKMILDLFSITDGTDDFMFPSGVVGELSSSTIGDKLLSLYVLTSADYAITYNLSLFSSHPEIYLFVWRSGLSSAQVDAILQSVWNVKEFSTSYKKPVLMLGSPNSAPTGVYQAASPPTTGNEFRYDLVTGAYKSAGWEWTVSV